jgi:hypothetical protein
MARSARRNFEGRGEVTMQRMMTTVTAGHNPTRDRCPIPDGRDGWTQRPRSNGGNPGSLGEVDLGRPHATRHNRERA